MGEGFAIIPTEGKVCAPCDAKVETIFFTKHAIGLKAVDGTEMLIHIGIDTVNLNGKYFKSYVKEGDYVKAGDTLITFEMDKVKMKDMILSFLLYLQTRKRSLILKIQKDVLFH